MLSGLLLEMVLSVCACWFHDTFTLPSQFVLTDFGVLLFIIIIIVIISSSSSSSSGSLWFFNKRTVGISLYVSVCMFMWCFSLQGEFPDDGDGHCWNMLKYGLILWELRIWFWVSGVKPVSDACANFCSPKLKIYLYQKLLECEEYKLSTAHSVQSMSKI